MSRPPSVALLFRILPVMAAAVSLMLYVPAHANSATQPRDIITPPSGWVRENLKGSRSAALGLVVAQWWTFDRGDQEYINLGGRSSYGFTDESFAQYYRAVLANAGERIYAYRRQNLCNGEAGWYVKHHNSRYPRTVIVEDVFLVSGSKVYFASYNYPPSMQPSPSAERAIASLCVASPVIVKALVLPVGFTAPPGWLVSDPKRLGVPVWPETIAYYFSPNHPNDVLMLVRDRAEGEMPSAHELAAEKVAEDAMRRENVSETMLTWQTYGIQGLCNNNTGWLFKYTVAYGHERLAYEQMMLFGSQLYSAVYIHPAAKPAFKPATLSLRTLCPIKPAFTPAPTAQPALSATPAPTAQPALSPAPVATSSPQRLNSP